MLMKFVRDESGATAIEYSLIGALISLAILGGVGLVSGQVGDMFNNVGLELTKAAKAD